MASPPAAGPPPVYIGFGSLLVDNPKGLTKMILSAARRTDQRIILCRCRLSQPHAVNMCLLSVA